MVQSNLAAKAARLTPITHVVDEDMYRIIDDLSDGYLVTADFNILTHPHWFSFPPTLSRLQRKRSWHDDLGHLASSLFCCAILMLRVMMPDLERVLLCHAFVTAYND